MAISVTKIINSPHISQNKCNILKQKGIEGEGCRSNHIQPYLTQKKFFSFLHLRVEQHECRICYLS